MAMAVAAMGGGSRRAASGCRQRGRAMKLATTALALCSAAATGTRDGSSRCAEPIRPFFSAPLSTTGRRPATRTVNHTYGPYLLLTAPPHEDDQELLPAGGDAASSWSAQDSELVAETIAAEDWTVMVYCQQAPDLLLGSIQLQARLGAEPLPQQSQQAAAALENGALVAMDDISLHIFSWSDIVPCLPPALCTATRSAHYYERETHISKFIALVAVGTIALTSVAFIFVTAGRKPCWEESEYDDRYWESNIDLEKLEASHDLRSPNTAPDGPDASPTVTDPEVSTSGQANAHAQSAQAAQDAAVVAPNARPVQASCAAEDHGAVWRTHGSLRLEVAGSSSDDSIESFDSARDMQTEIYSRMV
jgi:hypothetical protein